MIAHRNLFIMVIIFCVSLSACSLNIPGVTKHDPESEVSALPVNVIALLPVENKTADARILEMLRAKLGEELRFKGYPQIATDLVDSRLSTLGDGKEMGKNEVIAPQKVQELLGADGAMYCSLKENTTSKHPFYTPVTVTVRCELRSTQTGESLWSAQSKGTSRSFDIVRSRLKMKSKGDLEAALEEAVGEVLETLPYGPHLRK
ncbi:MAG: GNA1162 family protein [Smithellaceae bacterium]